MVKNERGIALATTLVIMTVVSGLIAGIIFVGTQEQRVADNTRNAEQAFGAAETGVYEVLRAWSPTKMSSHGLVGTDSILIADSLSPQKSGRYSVQAERRPVPHRRHRQGFAGAALDRPR